MVSSRLSGKLVLVLAMMALAMFVVGCGDDDADDGNGGADAPVLSDPDVAGLELADEFMRLLQEKDVAGLDAYLSDAFIIQRASGSHHTKAGYLEDLPDIGDFEIVVASAVQSGGVLSVRWEMSVLGQVVDGEEYTEQVAPRLSVFQWDGEAGRWRMAGHANFNVPVQ